MMYNISTLDDKEKKILSQLMVSEKEAKHLHFIKLGKRDKYQARKTKVTGGTPT